MFHDLVVRTGCLATLLACSCAPSAAPAPVAPATSAAQPAAPAEAPAAAAQAHPRPESSSAVGAHAAGAQTTAEAPPASEHAHQHGSHGFHKDFSDAERFARAFDDPKRDAWQRPAEVIALLNIAPGSTVVDLGAGTGYFLPYLSKAVGPAGRVLALDVEAKMVEYATRRAREQKLDNVSARQVALDDPGLADQSVSRVLIVNTWHHIDDRTRYAQKLARGLAPGGQIWVVDFTLESDLGPPAKHRLPAERVVAELEGGGLRAEVVSNEGLPKQYLVRGSRRD